MTVKVCLTGSHGVGKTYIINTLSARALRDGWAIQTVTSPTRYVKSLGFANNLQLTFDTEWMCQALRIVRQCEAEKELSLLEEAGAKTLLLADRCLLDELSYTKEAIHRLSGSFPFGGFSPDEFLVTKEGDSIPNLNSATYLLKQYYPISYQLSYQNVTSFWDRVYYKPPHPDHPPEEDDDRLSSLKYQMDVDSHIAHHWRELDTKENFKGRAEILHSDRDEAVEQIWEDITEMMDTPDDH